MGLPCSESARGEGLLYVCDRLVALGDVVSYIGEKPDADRLVPSLENIGQIITDYSRAIRETVEEVYHLIDQHFNNGGVSILARLEHDKKSIEGRALGDSMNRKIARDAVQEIERFLKEDFHTITRLGLWFQEMVKRSSVAEAAHGVIDELVESEPEETAIAEAAREVIEDFAKPRQEKAHAATGAV